MKAFHLRYRQLCSPLQNESPCNSACVCQSRVSSRALGAADHIFARASQCKWRAMDFVDEIWHFEWESFGDGKFAESFSWKVQLLRTKMILTWMHFIPWEPMNHDMVSIGNNGCKIVSEIEAQWEGDARIRTQAAGRTPCDARQPIIKVLNNNQYVNREKLNLDHSSWMWNEYHPVPLSPGTSHLFSILPIVQMWIVMMDGGILPGIVWTDQNNSSANTCRYNVATGSRTPCNRFDLFCEMPNSGAATSRDLPLS